jgi:Domain of Unknown Function (DUF1080)
MMRYFTVLALTAAVLALDPKEKTYHFDKADEGKVPANWKAEQTGKGDGSVWKVVPDATAPSKSGFVLAQTAEGPSKLFNLCVLQEGSHADLELSVSFKALKGKEDQGGGLVWRYQDANNYYITRYNPLETNFRVYKVLDGVRMQLGDKPDLKLKAGEWHTIAVSQVGKKIVCKLDGEKHLEVEDDAITKPGKVGLWTKADAQTAFDNLRVVGLGN